MSLNLCLFAGKTCFDLFQTPTVVTERALARSPRDVYFAWLDEQVAATKPNVHPRADRRQRRNIMSSTAWKDYQAYAEQIRRHKQAVDLFIQTHPGARWGAS